MASMVRRCAPRGFALLVVYGVVAVHVAHPVAYAAVEEGTPAQLIGTWRGTSICIDLTAAPACHDETVVYEFTPGSRPGAVHWAADKVVAGQRQPIGEVWSCRDKAEGLLEGVLLTSGVSPVGSPWRALD